jgi:hypothetical protein
MQSSIVDKGQARTELNDEIKQIFSVGFGQTRFQMVPFPSTPAEAPDDANDGRPYLHVMSYDGITVGTTVEVVPELIARIFDRKGQAGSEYRAFRNHLVFLVADESRKEDMKHKMVWRLALRELKSPERLKDLAPHQQEKIKELESKSIQEVAIAIQQCYRHVFYPSRIRLGTSEVDLAHTALDLHATGQNPGSGQRAIILALQDLNKLRVPGDEPDSPTWVRDRTPLKKGQMTLAALRDEFRRDPALPILIEDDTFRRLILRGIDSSEYIYRRGELLYGQGDPGAAIQIDEQSFVLTTAYAIQTGIWPRKEPEPTEPKGPIPPQIPPTTFGGGGTQPPPQGPTKLGAPAPGQTTTPKPAGPGTFRAEGVLREALTRLWEQARSAKVARLGLLEIRIFDSSDAFKLLAAVGAIAQTRKTVKFEGAYETKEKSVLNVEFTGTPEDAKPVKEFLDPQFRAAPEHNFEATFSLQFEQGLELAGDGAEKLTEKLVRFASGAAYVTAEAEVLP